MVASDVTAEDVAEVFGDLTLFTDLLEIRAGDPPTIVPFEYERWRPEQVQFQKERTGRDIVLKSRQIGFTTLELARDLQYARTHTGVQVVIVVQDGAAKDFLFAGLKIMAAALERIGAAPKPKYSTKTELQWGDNNSIIRVVEAGNTESVAENRGRSGTIHRLHLTEVAFYGAAAATINAMVDAVPAHGEILIESTANGVGNVFHKFVELAQEGSGPYKLHFYPWFAQSERRSPVKPDLYTRDYPDDELVWMRWYREQGLDDAQIQWWVNKVDEKRAYGGLEQVLQEFPPTPEAAFRTGDGQWIPSWVCDVLSQRIQEPLRIHTLETEPDPETGRSRPLGDLRVYTEPEPHQDYIIGADISEGVEGDDSAATVVHAHTGLPVAAFNANTIEPGDYGLALAAMGRLYNRALIVPERNKECSAVLRALRREANYARIYTHEDGREGWLTTGANRPVLWDELRAELVESAQRVRDGGEASIWTPDAETVAQCRAITRGRDGKPAARGKGTKGGAKDDLYVSWAIAWQVRGRGAINLSNLRGTGRGSQASRATGRTRKKRPRLIG